MSEACPVKILFVSFFPLLTVVDQMVLHPVSCTEKIHFTAVYALQNDKFTSLRGGLSPHTSLSFVHELIY